MPPHFVCSRRSRLPSRWPSARTKAKNPAIKANRASSRQTPNFRSAPVPGPSKHQTCRRIVMPYPSIPPRPPETRNPQTETRFSANQAPIKAKTPAIVHHQGISRHPQKNTRPLDAWCLELPFAPSRLKTPAIKAHRASSRQTMKKQTARSSANGAASYQPRATPWVCTPYATNPERAGQPPTTAQSRQKPL